MTPHPGARPVVRPPTPALAAGLALAATAFLAACGSTGHAAVPTTPPTPPTTAAPPTTPTTSTTVPPTTTTTVIPPELSSTPDAASGALIQDWENGDRVAAARVAVPAAVRALFAHRYSGEVLNDRGCGAPGPNPIMCTWGPYALASPTNPIYDVTVLPAGSAWYVSAVVKET